MRVILAPMEGVLDPLVRELLTAVNDYDLCITEFLRVVDALLPVKCFYRLCPELLQGSRTASGTPVRIQLLGQHPQWLAENAARAIELGSFGIDFNCGCPSKLVNGSGGGATLLKDPQTIYLATRAIRQAVPKQLPVTVKIRLGWNSTEQSLEIADAVQQGGATEITVHGRTKEDGYQADKINWQAIGEIRKHLHIPVIANGEIWHSESAHRCMEITGCDALMLGRGALNIPNLSRVVKYQQAPMPWSEVTQLLHSYLMLDKPGDKGMYHVSRIKQWLGYLRKEYSQAAQLFSLVRTLKDANEIARVITI